MRNEYSYSCLGCVHLVWTSIILGLWPSDFLDGLTDRVVGLVCLIAVGTLEGGMFTDLAPFIACVADMHPRFMFCCTDLAACCFITADGVVPETLALTTLVSWFDRKIPCSLKFLIEEPKTLLEDRLCLLV